MAIVKKNQRIRIKLKGFDHKLIDKSTWEIVDTAKRTGAQIKGPVLLPTKIERYTVYYCKNSFISNWFFSFAKYEK